MTAMDMNITVEDGLRLSELKGQLAQLQYNLDHIDMTTMPSQIAICAAIGLLFAFVSWGLYTLYTECVSGFDDKGKYVTVRKHEADARIWAVGTFLIVIAACALACYITKAYYINDIQSSMAGVQAQIDEILSKYSS